MSGKEYEKHFGEYLKLADAIHLTRMGFAERIQAKDPSAPIEEISISPAELLDNFIGMHAAQIDQLLRIIGNLESRLAAVQEAAGVGVIEYPHIDDIAVQGEQ